MAVFRIEKTRDYTVMSNHHLRNRALSLKAKGLLSQMLSLPEESCVRMPDDPHPTQYGHKAYCRRSVRLRSIPLSPNSQRNVPDCSIAL